MLRVNIQVLALNAILGTTGDSEMAQAPDEFATLPRCANSCVIGLRQTDGPAPAPKQAAIQTWYHDAHCSAVVF